MRYAFVFFILLTGSLSCKKAVEKVGEDLLINLMTNGRWVVTNYTRGGTDVTADFSSYQFQFRENRTVEAIKNNILDKTGTWEANALTRTISSSFTNAVQPLSLLNGDFYITDSSTTTVDATQTVNGELRILKLKKI